MNESGRPSLVYDGICNLCTSVVRFLYSLRGEGLIQYVPFQELSGQAKRAYGLSDEDLRGRMYLIKPNGSLSSGPFAIAEVCRLLTPFNFICEVFRSIPGQRLYDWVARRRYRIFGCRGSCFVVRE